ncbi:phage portal protein [Frankia sp. AgB1.9]|nr:phage portal protein [Frankia sp. AgW1.1]MBL7546636.1 phage portal protein [Frankia sp. AgB1.9]
MAAGTPAVTQESALRHSAVWSCLRLRANLISTMPIDLYRRVDGIQVEVPKPPVLLRPGGAEGMGMLEWLYASQFDLDRGGNAFGLILARDGMGFPAVIELVPLAEVTVRRRDGKVSYKIHGTVYQPGEIWHERQYTVAGLPFGLSPIAYAAWSIGEYLSIQQFALDWFKNSGIPSAHLKNTEKTLTSTQADETKRRFKAAVQSREVFVTGQDWDYDMIQADSAGADWIDAKRATATEIARFFDVPGDLIEAAVSGTSMTYANITQRNLQFLTMSLAPAIIRREDALSSLVPRPRYVKLKTDALLRMDPATRATMIKAQIDARVLAPSEARELDDRQPFTDAQLAEFDRLFGKGASPAPTAAIPGGNP